MCSKGSCLALCAPAATVCTSGDGGVSCIDTQTDNKNCGTCGSACKTLEACVAGKCQGGCPQGEVGCAPDAGAAYCAHVISDNLNCGSCFNACGPLSVCNTGACASECAQGQTTCSGDAGAYCATTQTDNSNCGTCGNDVRVARGLRGRQMRFELPLDADALRARRRRGRGRILRRHEERQRELRRVRQLVYVAEAVVLERNLHQPWVILIVVACGPSAPPAAPSTSPSSTTTGTSAIPSTSVEPPEQPPIAPSHAPVFEHGLASWYGAALAGHHTASGEIFDPSKMTAAHRTLKLGTWLEVKRTDTGKIVHVRVNDRGPVSHRLIIDLSSGAARELGMLRMGVAPVELRIIEPPNVR